VTEAGAGGQQTFDYDRYGNRWIRSGSWKLDTSPTSNIFEPTNNRMAGYTYDAAGNIILDSANAYDYDGESRLVKVVPIRAALETIYPTRFTYDADGRRITKEAEITASLSTFVYDAFGKLAVEYTTTGGEGALEYIDAGSRLLGVVKTDTVLPVVPEVRLTPESLRVAENAGSAVFKLSLWTPGAAKLLTPVTVDYTTITDPQDVSRAEPGSDYVATAGSIAFPADSKDGDKRPVSVPIINNGDGANQESFGLKITIHTGTSPTALVRGNPTQKVVIVSPANTPPVAAAGGPYDGRQGQGFSFDATASHDPDGAIQSYTWDFGDGVGGTGAMPRHTYLTPGPHTARLWVRDNKNAVTTTTADVSIAPPSQSPIVTFLGPTGCHPPCSVTFTAQATDPEGTPVTLSWRGCGTGTGSTRTCPIASLDAVSATVQAVDADGAATIASVTASGQNAAPQVTVTGGTPCQAPCTVSFAAQATDPDGDPLTYAWTGCAAGTATTATCQATGLGTLTASVTVRDSWGASTDASKSVAITQVSPAPQVTLSGATSCHPPSPTTPCTVPVTATATDPQNDPLTYAWSGCCSGTGTSSVCTVRTLAANTCTVVVSDNNGHSTSASKTVTGVNQAPTCSVGALTRQDGVGAATYDWHGTDSDADTAFTCRPRTAPGNIGASIGACTAGRLDIMAQCYSTTTETLTITIKDAWGAAGTCSNSLTCTKP
jgi:hypothetical protein